jgi:deoxyribodipyrimidine photo-lyase
MDVVWLKRDARIVDHEPLATAAKSELPVLLLYVYERCHMESDVYHESHHDFINEGLQDLAAAVRALTPDGTGGITYRMGCAVEALSELHAALPIHTLYSHHEVGNKITAERNSRVAAWAEANGVSWVQCRQDGVSDVRHAELDEGSWAKKWTAQMSSHAFEPPSRLCLVSPSTIAPRQQLCASACGVKHLGARPGAQRGGETIALATLAAFFDERGEGYCDELSSPLSGWDSCSRLSTYLAWGHVSLRHVFQALSSRQAALRAAKARGEPIGRWLKSLAALGSRLRWRSHFMQKLHDDPSMEDQNCVRTFDTLRTQFDQKRFDAWVHGNTGFPMVDACMRALLHSGWLNFRMRCMLVSFATYSLWLDWRPLTPVLARAFLDYEPGIHCACDAQSNLHPALTTLCPPRLALMLRLSHHRPLWSPVVRSFARRPAVPDAIGHDGHQCESHLQPEEAGGGSRWARLRLHPKMGARAAPRAN